MSVQAIPSDTLGDDVDDPIIEPDSSESEKKTSAVSSFARSFIEKRKPTKDTPKNILLSLGPPVAGIVAFLALWSILAPLVDTSLGKLPGPVEVLDAGRGLYNEYQATNEAKAEFVRTAPAGSIWSGPPTFLDQIFTSLRTVAFGFAIGTVIAVPIGLLSGVSKTFQSAINPLVQIFRPVSPVAWLPVVTYVVTAIVANDSFLAPSFVVSALVVTLCSLWPTLLNTAVGAQSVDKDLLNVAEVLRLSNMQKLQKLVIPSSLPYIFTGMRISLGIGWMVLIAAELLSQNPGLGKFVWDEFQGGSSESISRIMFSVFVIGFLGFILDRLMGGVETILRRSLGV